MNQLLIGAGRIKEGQTFRDIDDVTASKYIKRPDLILSKLPAPAVETTVEVAP